MIESRQPKVFPLLSLCIILLVTFASYLNALPNAFVYDDFLNVVGNPWIKDIKYLPEMFSSNVAGFDATYTTSYYRPLIHVIYMFTYALFSLNPWGFHFVNILFHACTSILVFFMASKLLSEFDPFPRPRMLSPAFFAALLFAAHPIHTAAVDWIAGIMDVSFALFFLLSLYLYMRSEEGGTYNYYLSIVSFFLATLCKEPALTLPFILIAYDYIFKRTDSRLPRYTVRYLPYLVVMGIYFALRLNALGGFAPSKTQIDLTVYQYIINIIHLFAQYIEKLIFPFNLSAIYSFHPLTTIIDPKAMISLVMALGIAFFAYAMRKDKVISFSLCLIIFPLLPVFYIRSIAGESVFAERYLYLPSSGYVIILALLLTRIRLSVSYQKIILAIVFFVLIASYSVGTIVRNMAWKNSYTLWTDTVQKNPDSAVAHRFLGFALFTDGRLDEAIEQYKTALGFKPDDEDAHLNLGVVYNLKGWTEQAILEFQTVLKLNPNNSVAHSNLGGALVNKGLIDEAVGHFQIAIKINPDNAAAYNGLGIAFGQKGLLDEAIELLGSAQRLEPNNPVYNDNLMKAYEIKNTRREK